MLIMITLTLLFCTWVFICSATFGFKVEKCLQKGKKGKVPTLYGNVVRHFWHIEMFNNFTKIDHIKSCGPRTPKSLVWSPDNMMSLVWQIQLYCVKCAFTHGQFEVLKLSYYSRETLIEWVNAVMLYGIESAFTNFVKPSHFVDWICVVYYSESV